MLILERNGRLDRQPRTRGWRARLLARLFGAKRKPAGDTTLLGTLMWEAPGMQGEDATVSGRI